ncbi:hypothetical protein IT403_00305 [Candidatus Nomurabacteria bacterium]|nr:hypothetical protein [Candidatus Nomurabacteria bacterium]
MESEDKNQTCTCGMGWAGCKGGCHTGKGRIVKWLIRFFILASVFCAGVKMGEFKGMMRGGYSHKCGGCTSMHTGMMSQDRDMMRGGMMGKKGDMQYTRAFGVITKVTGNTITISNNASEEQIILSQADTLILSENGEVGLSALKAGQYISVVGEKNAENATIAKMVKLSESVK